MKSPTPAPRLRLLAALLSAALAPLATHGQATAPAPKAPAAAARPAPPPAGGASDAIESMTKMIPEGKKNLKVHIPGFDSTGRTSSLVTAAAMTRINPQELFSENMRIDLYSKDPKENVRIDLKTSTYHMDNKLLTSQERSRVSRSDFQIEGDSMEFDTINSQGRMTGNVQMIIYDTASFGKKKDEPATAPAKTPRPPAKEPLPPGK